MVENSNFLFSLKKYVDAFLCTKADQVKEALRFFPNALTVPYENSNTTAKNILHILWKMERKYQSLQFVSQRKLFTRQENLDCMYAQLRDCFAALSIGNERSANQVSDDQVAALSDYFLNFCRVRSKLLAFYSMVVEKETLLSCSAKRLYSDLEKLGDTVPCSKNVLNSVLLPITRVLRHELKLLTSLLNAQFLISNLHFLSSLLCLASLSKESEITESSGDPETLIESSAYSPTPLFLWLYRFRNVLLSKFSLYWFTVLRNAGSRSRLNTCLIQEDPDLVLRIQSLTSRPDVSYACLFFDAQLQDFAYLGHSYVSPGAIGSAPKGVESLPCVFTMPFEAHPLPADDLSVVMTNFSAMLSVDASRLPRKVLTVFVDKLRKTLILTKVEPRVYLVVACVGDQTANAQIIDFVHHIADAIQLVEVAMSLRP